MNIFVTVHAKTSLVRTKIEIDFLSPAYSYTHYGTALMQRRTRSTTRCSLHTLSPRLPSRVGKLVTQKSLYTWFTTKNL